MTSGTDILLISLAACCALLAVILVALGCVIRRRRQALKKRQQQLATLRGADNNAVLEEGVFGEPARKEIVGDIHSEPPMPTTTKNEDLPARLLANDSSAVSKSVTSISSMGLAARKFSANGCSPPRRLTMPTTVHSVREARLVGSGNGKGSENNNEEQQETDRPQISRTPDLEWNTKLKPSELKERTRFLLEGGDGMPRLRSEWCWMSSLDDTVATACERVTIASHYVRRNRFTDVLPYDDNRVRLNVVGADEKLAATPGDYINASFIRINEDPHPRWIAAQGPIGPEEGKARDDTIAHFLQMIVEQKVDIVVMLTLCNELLVTKCGRYWPQEVGSIAEWDGWTAELISEERPADDFHAIVRRKLVIRHGEIERPIVQYQMESWADASAPACCLELLKLLTRVRLDSRQGEGPVVVHCSAGIGRTGVWLTVDAMLDVIESGKGVIDIPATILGLRKQRMRIVQNAEQYATIYETLVFALEDRELVKLEEEEEEKEATAAEATAAEATASEEAETTSP